MEKFHLMVFGCPNEGVHPEIRDVASSIECAAYDPEKMLDPGETVPDAILCFPPDAASGLTGLEIAQTLRCSYPKTPMFFLTSEKKEFDKKKLKKNGFNEVYLLPWEKADLLKNIRSQAIYTRLPELKNFKAVKVVDLNPGVVLDFSLKIYLPQNNKLLVFSHKGDPIEQEKFEKLLKNNVNTLFISEDEVEKFYEYTKAHLQELSNSRTMSETERLEKLERSVRDLVSDIFIEDSRENTFGKSQELLKDVKEVLNLMIKESHPDTFKKISTLMNQESGFYPHLSNVSAYVGIFSLILGLEKPEEIALAGLLHDLGKVNLPPEIADLEPHQMSKAALEAFTQHPVYTLDVLKLKRIPISDRTSKAILQHHERIDGTGFPAKIDGSRITAEAKLLAIADEFDHLTALTPGKPCFTPLAALSKLIDDNAKDPGNMALDLETLIKIKDALTGEANG